LVSIKYIDELLKFISDTLAAGETVEVLNKQETLLYKKIPHNKIMNSSAIRGIYVYSPEDATEAVRFLSRPGEIWYVIKSASKALAESWYVVRA